MSYGEQMEQQGAKPKGLGYFRYSITGIYAFFILMCVSYMGKYLNWLDSACARFFPVNAVIASIFVILTAAYFYVNHLRSWSKIIIFLQVMMWSLISFVMIELYTSQINRIFLNISTIRVPVYFSIFIIVTLLFLVYLNYRYDRYVYADYKLYFTIAIIAAITAISLLVISFLMQDAPLIFFALSIIFILVSFHYMLRSAPVRQLSAKKPASYVKMLEFKYAGIVIVVPIYLYLTRRISAGYFLAVSMFFVFYTALIFMLRHFIETDEKVNLQVLEHKDLAQRIARKKQTFDYANRELLMQSRTDVLTGLRNRNVFYHDLAELRKSNTPFSLMYIDLDRFKYVNDLHGHSMGDLLLIAITLRLSDVIREYANLYRIGGDEFAVTYQSVSDAEIVRLCKQIIAVFDEPLMIKNYVFNLSASVGVARYPRNAQTEEELLKFADIAMYQAKQYDKQNKYYIFSEKLHKITDRRARIARLLKTANIEDDFTVFYQPLWNAADQTVAGCEALLRWFHKEEGFISPAEFIPISEEIGVIYDLTLWVIQTVVDQVNQWKPYLPSDFKMGINLSPVVLNDLNFDQDIMKVLLDSRIDPSYIDIEITESIDMSTTTLMDRLFMSLFRSNISVSIDDFGTGYSSINYIKKIDVDTIKIAKELIDNIADREDERTLVKAIIMMSKGLHIETVAEGVETKQQLDILVDFGCDRIQGYYLGKPVDAKSFKNFFLQMISEG